MEIYEIVILTVVLIGCSWNAYYIGRREGRKDASQEAMIGTLIFAFGIGPAVATGLFMVNKF